MSVIDAQRRLLTIDEVAERLALSRRTVERKIRDGTIPSYQLGGPRTAVRVDARELYEWLGVRRMPSVSTELLPSADTDPAERHAPEHVAGSRGVAARGGEAA